MPTGRDESAIADYLAKSWSRAAFRPEVIFIMADDDFIYLGWPDKYEINVYSPEGKLVKKIIRDYDPIPVSDKDKDDLIERISESLSSLPIYTESLKKKAFQNIKFPKYKPAYQNFTLMENGWLAVIVDSIKDEYTLFDIFDQEGRYIAHFKTPELAEGAFLVFSFFKNGKAYAVVTEGDYKFVKRYNFEVQEYKDNKWLRKK